MLLLAYSTNKLTYAESTCHEISSIDADPIIELKFPEITSDSVETVNWGNTASKMGRTGVFCLFFIFGPCQQIMQKYFDNLKTEKKVTWKFIKYFSSNSRALKGADLRNL